MRNDGGGAQTEERVRFVYGFMRRSKSSTGMRRAHLFSGVSGGRRSASAAVDGATAIPHLNEDQTLFKGKKTGGVRKSEIGNHPPKGR